MGSSFNAAARDAAAGAEVAGLLVMAARAAWTGKVVVITGASAGVGRAIARAFAQRGASVGLVARGLAGLEAARLEVEALGGRAAVAQADVSDEKQVELAAFIIERELGSIDVWVNNAMVSVFAPVHETPPNEHRRVTEVTYLGYVWGTKAALRRMRPRNRGTIIQIGSALAYRAIPLQAAYCGAKHAIKGFTEALRTELLHDKSEVKVVMVELPAVNTPQFDWSRSHMKHRPQPVPPIFQPEIIAEAVVRAAERPRRELVLAWPAIKAILAEKIAPGLADRILGRTGYEVQLTSELDDPHRPDDLWKPVPGDHGAHGRFDDRAKSRSPAVWATLHRGAIAGTLAAIGAVVGALLLGLRRQRRGALFS